MKKFIAPRLLSGLTLSGCLFFSACTEVGPMPLPGQEPTGALAQELKVKKAHTDIGSAVGLVVGDGYTCGASNDIAPTCGSNDVNLSYGWTAPVTGQYTFTTENAQYDTVLQVNRYNPATGTLTAVGCNDDEQLTGQGNLWSGVTVNATAGEQFLISVDGYGCGRFQLQISAPACTTPPSQCHAASGTWSSSANACTYAPLAKGTTCNDGNAGTVGDSCDGAGACTGIPAGCTATVQCGDFECAGPVPSGQGFTILYGGSSLGAWSIRGDGIDLLNGSMYVTKDGAVSIDMNARERATISQTISTQPGQKYEVTFWVKWNTHPGPGGLVVEAVGQGQIVSQQQFYGYTDLNKSWPDITWMKYTFPFTADATSTRLSFHSSVPGTIGANLDAVSIACGK